MLTALTVGGDSEIVNVPQSSAGQHAVALGSAFGALVGRGISFNLFSCVPAVVG
jgi:hypothetical protein